MVFTSLLNAIDLAIISYISILPDPVVIGGEFTVRLAGTVKGESIKQGAGMNIQVKLGIFTIKEIELDLCQETSLNCPVETVCDFEI